MPEVGGTFVQGESEVASVNMVYGAASADTRSMTSSSSCSIALKSEGISYCASDRIPMVYCNVQRGGPGVGAIQPTQQDYNQATKASGNGGFRMMVLAPFTVQEAVDLTYKAFDYADRDRNPVLVLADGVIGTMMEPVELPKMKSDAEVAAIKDGKKKWACIGHELDYANRAWIEPGHWSTVAMQQANEEAEIVLTAYGICGRIAANAVDALREQGVKAGMIRPITVYPFPYAAYDKIDYTKCKGIVSVEMSIPAQFADDVKATVKERCAVTTCLCSGGNIMSREAVLETAKKVMEG